MKYNFNIDAIDDAQNSLSNSEQNLLSKSKHNSMTQKKLIEFNESMVDLGLPSETFWCKYNLGVDPNQLSKPEDWYGDYYAWGELKSNKTFKELIYFYCDNYKWYNEQSTKYTKYNKQDKLTQLLPEDDAAAYQNKKFYNYEFHIPTKEQCEELINYTKNYWVKNYDPNKIKHNPEDDKGIQDLNGTLFISKINSTELFIPDANYHDMENNGHEKNSYLGKKRYDSAFWTACLDLSNYSQALACIFFDDDYDNKLYGGITTKNRWAGLPIRPILKRNI